jgi:hypothetical protein
LVEIFRKFLNFSKQFYEHEGAGYAKWAHSAGPFTQPAPQGVVLIRLRLNGKKKEREREKDAKNL